MFGIRAGDVQLVCRNPVATIQFFDNLRILVFVETENVYEHRTSDLSQKWHLIADEGIDAHVLQPDRVQHSRCGWKQSWRQIAFDRARRCTLYADASDASELRKPGKLFSISKGSTGGDNGVWKLNSGHFDGEI